MTEHDTQTTPADQSSREAKRPRRLLTVVGATAILLAGVGVGLAVGSANAVPAAAPTSAPPTTTPAATPSPSVDPVCADTGLRKFLGEVQAEFDRGAFDDNKNIRVTPDHVGAWMIELGPAKYDADLQIYKTLTSVEEAIRKYFVEGEESNLAPAMETTIRLASSTLALECRLADGYTFDEF